MPLNEQVLTVSECFPGRAACKITNVRPDELDSDTGVLKSKMECFREANFMEVGTYVVNLSQSSLSAGRI